MVDEMVKTYEVTLSNYEQHTLISIIKGGIHSSRKITRAHILLLANEGKKDREIAVALHTSIPTVQRTRQRYCEWGLDRALNDLPRPGGQMRLDARNEAILLSLVNSDPPEGNSRWTNQLLADTMKELQFVDQLSRETVRRTLKKLRSERV